jgi:phospholipase D1/2
MNGQPYRASRLAATLRRQLWREHLGLLRAQDFDASGDPNARPPDVSLNKIDEGPENEFVMDPLSDGVWNTWTSQATGNTETYRMLFRADPDDHIKTFEDYDNFRPRGTHKEGHLFDPYMPAKDVREKLDLIKGHLVWLPLDFLRDAEMAEPGLAVNQITEVRLVEFSYIYVANYSIEYLYLDVVKVYVHFPFNILSVRNKCKLFLILIILITLIIPIVWSKP